MLFPIFKLEDNKFPGISNNKIVSILELIHSWKCPITLDFRTPNTKNVCRDPFLKRC